jgi:hypothetical protein
MDVRCCTPLSRARVGWASIYMGSGPTPLHGRGRGSDLRQPACSVGWWLMAGAGLFWENSTAGWLLVAGLFWEKSTAGWWLISRANRLNICWRQDPFLLVEQTPADDSRRSCCVIALSADVVSILMPESWRGIIVRDDRGGRWSTTDKCDTGTVIARLHPTTHGLRDLSLLGWTIKWVFGLAEGPT